MRKALKILSAFLIVGGLFTVIFFGVYGTIESIKQNSTDNTSTTSGLPAPEKSLSSWAL